MYFCVPFTKIIPMIFYFSGCGNSRHVAETLAAQMNDEMIFIPEAARAGHYNYSLSEGEPLGFVFPIYSWAPPRLVLDFLKQLRMAQDPGYVYFACKVFPDEIVSGRLKALYVMDSRETKFMTEGYRTNLKIRKCLVARITIGSDSQVGDVISEASARYLHFKRGGL